jgi:mRNA interferase MazF
MQQGEIWLVDFDPSVGHEYQKVRPALVIEATNYVPFGSLVTVAPISSQVEKAGLLDVLVPRNPENRLVKDSLVKTRQLSSFDKRRFIRLIGTCQPEVLHHVLQNIRLYLELP